MSDGMILQTFPDCDDIIPPFKEYDVTINYVSTGVLCNHKIIYPAL